MIWTILAFSAIGSFMISSVVLYSLLYVASRSDVLIDEILSDPLLNYDNESVVLGGSTVDDSETANASQDKSRSKRFLLLHLVANNGLYCPYDDKKGCAHAVGSLACASGLY